MTSVFDALLETMVPMDDERPNAKILIYGDSGVGKTVLAASAGNKILWIDSTDGWVSLMNHPELRAKCQRMQYQGLSQIDALCDAIDANREPFVSFDTIVVDELSSIAVMDLDKVLESRSKKQADKDPNVPTQPDFFANTERMRRAVTRLIQLPMNIILVSHVREDRDDRTGKTYIRPSFTPKLRTTIKQMCHIVGHLTIMEVVNKESDSVDYLRKMQVQPSLTIDAKTRIGNLEPIIENPDLGKIITTWQESGGSEVEIEELLFDEVSTINTDIPTVDVPSGLEI